MDYRAYFLDDQGRIRACLDCSCPDDAVARRFAADAFDGRAMELWNLDRLVETYPARENRRLQSA